MPQGAALAEELTGLRGEVGEFSNAMARLQRQRADERSELLELQDALKVCFTAIWVSGCSTR